MNNYRRRSIKRIIAQISDLAAQLHDLHSDEEDALDNLPDNLRYTDRAEAMEWAISELEDQGTALEDVAEALGELIGEQ